MVAPLSSALTSSTLRNPKRRRIHEVAGLIPMLANPYQSTSNPDRKGFSPNPSWNSSGSRNGTVLIMLRDTKPPVMLTLKVGIENASNDTMG